MKQNIILITFLSATALAAGCDKEQITAQQMETVKTETKTAAQDMKDYTYAQKAEFVAAMHTQLTALNQDLDQLAAKIESSNDAAKAEARPKLQALRDQASQLNKQLDEARNATGSTWESVKADSQKAWDSLKDGVQQSRQWLSAKIAP